MQGIASFAASGARTQLSVCAFVRWFVCLFVRAVHCSSFEERQECFEQRPRNYKTFLCAVASFPLCASVFYPASRQSRLLLCGAEEMGAARKLQAEIDRTLKKVQEGIVEFDQIWDKVSTTSYAPQLSKSGSLVEGLRD